MHKITILLIIFSVGRLMAQREVTGIVTDAGTRLPIAGANVKADQINSGAVTDPSGVFTLKVPENSKEVNLIISHVGYNTMQITLPVWEKVTVLLVSDLTLEEVIIHSIRAGSLNPVSQSTISKKEIERKMIGQDAGFIIEKLSPSIISYSESGTSFSNYGQIRLRGIDQTRINITLNGSPLNDMIDQGVFFSNFTDFGNSIESMQVQRGVGTSTNGTSSYAGSINFESVNLFDTVPSAEVQLLAGSFNTYRASAELKTGLLPNHFSFYSRYTLTRSDGYRYHSGTDSHSLFFSGGYHSGNDVIKLTGFTGQSKNGLAYLPVSIRDIQADPKTNYVNENDIDDFGQDFLQLHHTHWFLSNLSLASGIYFGAAGGDFPATFPVYDSIFDSNSQAGFYISERLVQINYPLFNKHYGIMSSINYSNPSGKFELTAGIHAYRFNRENLESVMPDNANPYYDEKSQKNEISGFLKSGYTFGKLDIYGDIQVRTIGFSINPDDQMLPGEPDIWKNWFFFNPKLGITYRSGERENLYLFWGRSSREPTKVDILGGFQLNSYNLNSVKSDDVKPEHVNNLEGGFRIRRDYFNASINFFNMAFRDEIAPIGELVPEGFIQLRKNIPESYRRGFELDLSVTPIPNIEVYGNATYMHSKIREYAPIGMTESYQNVSQPLSPEFMGNFGIRYNIPFRAEFETSGRYISQSFLEPTNDPSLVIPSSMVLSASIRIYLFRKHTLQLIADNLFNELYYTNGTPVDSDYDGNFEPGYFVQAPRNFYILLQLRF